MTKNFCIILQHFSSIPQSYLSISKLCLDLHAAHCKCDTVQCNFMSIIYKTDFFSTVLPNLSMTGQSLIVKL